MIPQKYAKPSHALPVLLLAASLVGCSPAPMEGAPRDATPMVEHAAARAEVVYRGYIDALGLIDLTDPAEFERLAEFTTPDSYSQLRAALERLGNEGVTTRGRPEVLEFFATQVEEPRKIRAVACTDDREYELIDEQGQVISDSTSSSRYRRESVEFVIVDDRLVISSSFAMSVDECEEIVGLEVYEG